MFFFGTLCVFRNCHCQLTRLDPARDLSPRQCAECLGDPGRMTKKIRVHFLVAGFFFFDIFLGGIFRVCLDGCWMVFWF